VTGGLGAEGDDHRPVRGADAGGLAGHRLGARAWPRSTRGFWWCCFALVVLVGGAWALGSPLGGAPDEPSHVITAVAMSHGQGLGSPITSAQRRDLARGRGGRLGGRASAYRSVSVPRIYDTQNWGCFAFHPERTAGCMRFRGSTAAGPAVTPVEWYSPAYYVWVGTIARPFAAGPVAVYAMRFASVVLVAALLASAAASLSRLSNPGLALAGLLVAVTPMVLFLGASVNPSGLETAAAISMWATGLVLVHEASRNVDTRLVVRFAAAASVLILARHPGPIWAGLIGLVLSSASTAEARRRLRSSGAVRAGLAAVACCAMAQAVWILVAQPFSDTHNIFRHGLHSLGQIAQASVGESGSWLHQMIGTFGWLDTPTPPVVVVLWLLAAGALVLGAMLLASRTDRRNLLVSLELAFAVPVVLAGLEASQLGAHWQGRYQLPFVAGLPILAATSLGRSVALSTQLRALLTRFIPAAVVVGTVVAFAQNLRRYAVGYHGTIVFWVHARWSPPLHPLVLLAGMTLGLVTLTALFSSRSRPSPVEERRRSGYEAVAEVPLAGSAANLAARR
jgi:Predicted membrane protein (DUF2142)